MILKVIEKGKDLGMINYPVIPRVEEWIALPGERIYEVKRVTYDFRTDHNEVVTLTVQQVIP